jgi:hypothetical protein
MAATRTGIGQRDETGWGEEEDVVTTAAKMLSREGAVHDATWGGGVDDARRCRQNTTNLKGQIDRVVHSKSITRFRLVVFQEMNT